jgi:hypothetical protein
VAAAAVAESNSDSGGGDGNSDGWGGVVGSEGDSSHRCHAPAAAAML